MTQREGYRMQQRRDFDACVGRYVVQSLPSPRDRASDQSSLSVTSLLRVGWLTISGKELQSSRRSFPINGRSHLHNVLNQLAGAAPRRQQRSLRIFRDLRRLEPLIERIHPFVGFPKHQRDRPHQIRHDWSNNSESHYRCDQRRDDAIGVSEQLPDAPHRVTDAECQKQEPQNSSCACHAIHAASLSGNGRPQPNSP